MNNYTTDYRGKIITFNPKGRNKENMVSNVRINTVMDSCRAEGINLSNQGVGKNVSRLISYKYLP